MKNILTYQRLFYLLVILLIIFFVGITIVVAEVFEIEGATVVYTDDYQDIIIVCPDTISEGGSLHVGFDITYIVIDHYPIMNDHSQNALLARCIYGIP